jgi:hypothetical protein
VQSSHGTSSSDDSSSSDDDESGPRPVAPSNRSDLVGWDGHKVLPTLGEELNHASCIKDLSFCKLNWTVDELNRFHRPDISDLFAKEKGEKMTARPRQTKKETKKSNTLTPHDYFRDRFRLSLRDGGKFCAFEHIDQNPLFVNNFGMASRLKRYYYGDRAPHHKDFK